MTRKKDTFDEVRSDTSPFSSGPTRILFLITQFYIVVVVTYYLAYPGFRHGINNLSGSLKTTVALLTMKLNTSKLVESDPQKPLINVRMLRIFLSNGSTFIQSVSQM